MSAVLAVVLMVLKIIGMILLALLLLLLLALLLPAGIHFRWSHIGGLRLQLCYGPLHFTLYPRKADEEEKKAEPKAETKQGNTPKTEPTSAAPPKPTPPPAKAKSAPASQPGAAAAHAPAAETPAAEPQPEEDTGEPEKMADNAKAAVRADPVGYVWHLFSVLRASVGPLLRGFRVSKLNVIWTITGETAAETAILYGQTLTTLNTILAIAQDHIKIQADQLWLEADYTGSAKQQRVVSLKLLLCPLLALVTVVCFVWHARHDPQLLPPKHPKYNTPETEQGGNL